MQTTKTTLILIRENFLCDRTIGSFLFGRQLYTYTLEPPYYPPANTRHNARRTAIPYGVYRLKFHFSPRFQSPKLYLCDVPRRSGIMIHPGNTPAHTSGCILPGMDIKNGSLTESCAALQLIENLTREILTTSPDAYIFITR